MKPFPAEEICGNWATVLLPIKEDESVDYRRMQDALDAIAAANVDGVYTNGTAGEFLTQTEKEFDEICRITAETCEKHGIPFQLGASHVSPQITLTRALRAAEFAPCAIQVILPDWSPVTNDEAVVFLRKVCETIAPVGVVLYNPPHAKRVLAPADFGFLKKHLPNLVGVKVMDGDAAWYAQMREFCGDLSVFVPGHHLATGYAEGVASGSYSSVACLNPRGAQAWYELMRTDIDSALRLERRIREFYELYVLPFRTEGNYSNAALDKLLAHIGGWSETGTRLRFPYRWIPESEAVRLRLEARELLPELFIN